MSNNPFLNIRVPQSLINQRLPTDKNLHDPSNPFNQTAKKLEARNTNKIRENALMAVDMSPEETLSLRRLGARNNIPARMMLGQVDPTKVRSQEIVNSAQNFLKANPRMSEFLQNPGGVQIIQDDFDGLQHLSYLMRAIAETEEDVGVIEETTGVVEGLAQHYKSLAKSAELFIEKQTREPGGIEAHLRRQAGHDDYVLPMVQKMWGITEEMLEEREAQSIVNEENLTNELREIRIQIDYLRSRGEQEGIGYYAREITSGFLHMVPAVVASMATANPAVGASIMFGDVAMSRYGEASMRGAGHEAAMAEGALFGYVEYLTEKFAIDKIIRIGKGNKVADFFVAAGAEGVSEMFATAFEIGYDTGILDEDMTMAQAVTALVDSGVIGFGVGGSMRLTTDAVRMGTEMLSPDAAINNARARQEQMTEAQKAVQQTKTAARDTETMREVLDAMGDEATVYLDAEDIIELHQSGVLVDTTIPYTLSQEAMTIEAISGGAIEVKVSDLLTLTEEQFNAVSPLVRDKAGAINAREAEEMLLERETVTQKLLEDFQAQMQQDTGYQPIYDNVRKMLVDAGRSETEAARMAQVWQANYEQLARDHQTKTAEELFLEHFVSVRRPGEQVQQPPLAQEAVDPINTPQFRSWFKQSEVVGEDGAPIVVHHGTKAQVSPEEGFIFDYSRIGEQGRAEGAGFYFTPVRSIAEGYGADGTVLDVYLSIQDPITYDQEGFEYETVREILERVAELEADRYEWGVGDGFLSNFGDVSFEGYDSVLDSAAEMVTFGSETALDQISGLVGSNVDIDIVNRATEEVTGHDGVYAKGFSGEGGADIWVAFFPEQIKSVDNVGRFNERNADIFRQFAGMQAQTAAMEELGKAREMLDKGVSMNTIRRDTGWFVGHDGAWRFEISDDKAKLILGELEDMEDLTVGSILDHELLFEAYPDIAMMPLKFVKDDDFKGMYSPSTDTISISVDLDQDQMLSTLLHEIQHSIQEREDFARGGDSNKEFTDSIKEALERMKEGTKAEVEMWEWRNQWKIKTADKAAEIARDGLIYQSVQRLIEYSKRDKPSSVFRHIRNELQWIHHEDLRGEDGRRPQALTDLNYRFYGIPKRGQKRQDYLRDLAFDAAQILKDFIPEQHYQMFENDQRTTNGMIKSLQREATKASKALGPLTELQKKARAAARVSDQSRFKSPYEIYQALSGEVEARVTQARQALTPEERRLRSPELDIEGLAGDEIVILMGSMEIRAPVTMMAQEPKDQTRGMFQQEQDTYGNLQNIITLTEAADRSTFLHETGHFWLFQLNQMRNDPDLTEAGKAKMDSQWAGAMSWFEGNAKSAWSDFKKMEKDARKKAEADPAQAARAKAMTAALKHAEANGGADYMVEVAQGFMSGQVKHGTLLETAFHEQWARGVEQYFMEGKAPTQKLRGAFRAFARWLRGIYATLKSLNVTLTPEVREVFDKFLVAGNAIDNERGKLIYRIPQEVRDNATAKELERLNQLVTEAENEAEAELQARVTKDLQHERKQEYRDKKATIKKEVEADVAQRPLYKALRLLRKGEGLDNHPEGEPVYLDRTEVESLTDADTAKKMPRGTFTKKEGAKVVPIEIAAGIAGFDNAMAMIEAMTSDYPSEASVVKTETEGRAADELADLIDPATIGDTAAEIVQNDKQAELMTLQAKILGRIGRQAARKAAEKRAAEEGAPAAAEDIAALEEARVTAEGVDTAEAAVEPQMEQILEEEQRKANIQQRKAQTAAGQRIRQMSRAMDHAAIKEAAKRYVDTMPAGKMTPQRFRQTAERIAKRLHVAIAKRDYELAGDLMQQQAMNLAVAKQVNEAQKKMESQRKRIRNRMKKSDKDLGKLYNTDLLNGIRLLLEPLKVINPRARGMQPAEVMEKLKAEDPNLAAEIEATRTAIEQNTKQYIEQAGKQDPWKVMPYGEYAALMKTVETIMARARDEKSMVIDGQRIEFEQIADEILDATKDIKPAEKQAVGRGTERQRWMIGAMTTFKNYVARVELWARGVDGQDDGPLTRYLIQPVMKAANAYREARQEIAIQLRDMVLPMKDELAREVRIEAPELDGYVFNTKGEILHLLLHTGNESNLRKLLLGGAVDVATGKRYNWTASSRDSDTLDTSRVDAFIDRMFREGVLNKTHMDLVQGIWNLFEQTKGPAQQAHKRMHGHYFEEIPAREVVTPFGVYEGGYVPAVYDSLMNDEGAKRDALAQIEGAQTAAMFPGADEGFTKGRVDYNEPLDLNLMHIVLHLDKVQKFTYFGPVVRDAARMISNRRIRSMLNSVERDSVDEMLVPWLQRTARQTTSEPANKFAGGFWSFLNRSAGLQTMAGNIVNSIQQYTGFIAATTIVKPSYLSKAMFTFRQDELSRREYIITKSPYMASRMVSSVNDMVSDITSALTDKNLYDKAKTAANRYGYILQQMVQNTIDPAVWLAAEAQFKDGKAWQKVYDNNVDELGDFGAREKADAAAIAFADRVVRDTQTPLEPQDVARIEALGPFAKMFTKFAGYFINMHNLSKTEWKIATRNIGYESAIPGRRFQIFLIMYLNYVIAEGLAMAIRGSFDDIEEKEDEDLYWEAFNLAVMSPIKGVAGVLPGANSLISYGMGQFTPQFYDDRLSASPVLSIVEGGANAGVRFSGDVYALLTEGETDRDVHRSVKDLLNAIGIMTGLPTNWANKPITYAIKVEEGVADPEGAMDIVQGALTGRDGTE